jgi:hypothetical protein
VAKIVPQVASLDARLHWGQREIDALVTIKVSLREVRVRVRARSRMVDYRMLKGAPAVTRRGRYR